MSQKVKVTKAYIEKLKQEIEQLKKDNHAQKADIRKFRMFYKKLLTDNVSMNSKNQYFSSETMVLKLSRLMNDVSSWTWGWE